MTKTIFYLTKLSSEEKLRGLSSSSYSHSRYVDELSRKLRKILFRYELSLVHDKQNCRIGSDDNPPAVVEAQLHPSHGLVSSMDKGIQRFIFLKNEVFHNVAAYGELDRGMINDFFVPELENVNVDNFSFLQDGSSCYTPNETINYRRKLFVIALSCALNTVELFFVNLSEVACPRNTPETADVLEDNIAGIIKSGRKALFTYLPKAFIAFLKTIII